jgi:hypothetical protein
MRSSLHRGCAAITLTMLAVGLSGPASADTPQRFSATIDGRLFESDDDGILYLMPTKSTLNLIASTKGASAYPPPKTPIDRLSFNCRNFEGKPRKYADKDFGSAGCEVRFIKGESKVPGGAPEAEYKLADGDKLFELTSVSGKVIEGRFAFDMVNIKTGARIKLTGGSFKAEDRQK